MTLNNNIRRNRCSAGLVVAQRKMREFMCHGEINFALWLCFQSGTEIKQQTVTQPEWFHFSKFRSGRRKHN